MFEKLATLFNSHEDTFTRTQTQFVEHWQSVSDFLVGCTGVNIGDVYDTKAAVHIADMIYMIQHDKVPDDADYGPCVEFILQHAVLGTLQQYAQNDVPVGMRRLVLSFFSQLVQKLERSAIPHVNIHQPLQDMINVCGGGKYPIDEINFITSVLAKFHEDPSLVNIFMIESNGKHGISNYELRIVDALISLSHSKDNRVAMKSCEGLLLCVAADSEYIIDNVLSYTILVQDLVSRLCQRYNIFQSEPSLLVSTQVSWNTQLEQDATTDTTHLTSTLKVLLWLDYINILSCSAHPNFTNKFNKHLSKVFFYTHLLNDMTSTQDQLVLKALYMCQKMLRMVTSELLFVEVLKFLTDEAVIAVLCSLLNRESEPVVENTLHLFCDMIDTHHSVVIETLVLKYTKCNTNVRSRIVLSKEPVPVRTFTRTNSGDSGVEEMLSDEETSYIHMSKPANITTMSGNITTMSDNITTMSGNMTVPNTPPVREGEPSAPHPLAPVVLDPVPVPSPSPVPDPVSNPSSAPVLDPSPSPPTHPLDSTPQLCTPSETTNIPSPGAVEEVRTLENTGNLQTVISNTDTAEISNTIDSLSHDMTSLSCVNTIDSLSQLCGSEHPECGSMSDNPPPGAAHSNPPDNPVSPAHSHHCKTVIVSHDCVESDSRISREPGYPGPVSANHSTVFRSRVQPVATPSLDVSVERFLNIMPEFTQPRMVGYAEYLHDAHLRLKEEYLTYSWIPTQNSELEESNITYETGTFLGAIVSMITSIPYQGFKVNMLLMSLISEICYIPHYTVTHFLLDTALSEPTLYDNLLEVAASFSEIFEASPTLYSQLMSTNDNEANSDVCKAVYLTEEFCKELAAIALVKST